MANDAAYDVLPAIPEALRPEAAALFWQGFKGKIGPVLRPDHMARAFLERVLDPSHGICAVSRGGALLGIAGFKTDKGAMIGGTYSDIAAIYGHWGGLWRGMVLSVLERDRQAGVLLMDGIVVSAEARGQGVGTALLRAIKSRAAALGQSAVRLDVIDSNPRAKALYTREGFIPQGQTQLGPFARLFGFKSALTMQFPVPPGGAATIR